MEDTNHWTGIGAVGGDELAVVKLNFRQKALPAALQHALQQRLETHHLSGGHRGRPGTGPW